MIARTSLPIHAVRAKTPRSVGALHLMDNLRPYKREKRPVESDTIQFGEISVDLGVRNRTARVQEEPQDDFAVLGHLYPGKFQKPQNSAPAKLIFTLQE
jgi:hypothetical protein